MNQLFGLQHRKGSGTLCSFALPIRQPLLLVRFAALFAMKREIEEQLAHAIAQKQRQCHR